MAVLMEPVCYLRLLDCWLKIIESNCRETGREREREIDGVVRNCALGRLSKPDSLRLDQWPVEIVYLTFKETI